MKRTVIITTLIATLLSAVYASAQTPYGRLTFSEGTNQAGVPTGTVTFFDTAGPVTMQVFEAVIPAPTEAACFASRDFSMARPVGPDRATVVYDAATSSYKLQWTQVKDRRDSCRVLRVGTSPSAGDLAFWQANYGASGLSSSMNRGTGSYGRGTFQISLDSPTIGSSLLVRYPAQEDEVVDVAFPSPANSNFRLLEASFPANTDAECVANQDLSAMVPVGSDRATIGYYPSSGVWFLRNSNAGTPDEPCHVLLANGDNTVDAGDFAVWRSSFGNTLFGEGDGWMMESAGSIDEDARQPGTRTTQTVTFTYTVTNTSSAGPFLR